MPKKIGEGALRYTKAEVRAMWESGQVKPWDGPGSAERIYAGMRPVGTRLDMQVKQADGPAPRAPRQWLALSPDQIKERGSRGGSGTKQRRIGLMVAR